MRFLLFAYRASWKGIMGRILVWFEFKRFCMLEYSGEKRGLFLLFFCFGLELSGKALMAPGSAPWICTHTPTYELVPWANCCPQSWPESSGHLELQVRASRKWMLWRPLGIGDLQRSWQHVPCANEARWEEECSSCRSWAVFTWAVWMWIKNKPGKTFVGEGRSSMLVKTDNPCAVSRGKRRCVLRTPGKKNKTGLWHAVSKKMKRRRRWKKWATRQPSTPAYKQGLDLQIPGGRVGIQGLAAALRGVNHNLSMTQLDLAVVKMLNVNMRMFTVTFKMHREILQLHSALGRPQRECCCKCGAVFFPSSRKMWSGWREVKQGESTTIGKAWAHRSR